MASDDNPSPRSSFPPTATTHPVISLELSHVSGELIEELLIWQQQNGIGAQDEGSFIRRGMTLRQYLRLGDSELVVAWLASKGVVVRCWDHESSQIRSPTSFIAPTKASPQAKRRRGKRVRD